MYMEYLGTSGVISMLAAVFRTSSDFGKEETRLDVVVGYSTVPARKPWKGRAKMFR